MEKIKTGWLSPTGEFFPAGLYDHIEVARELADSLNLPSYDFKKNRAISDDDKLLNAGWVYIGIGVYFEHEWRVGWNLRLSPEQIRFLKPYFEESDIPMNEIAKERWELETEES